MAVTAGDILRIAIQWFADGTDEVVNVHTFDVEDVGDSTDDFDFMINLAGVLAGELYDVVIDAVADNVVGATISGFNFTKNEVLPPVNNPMDGASAGSDSLPRQVTALVFMNTNEPRRQGRSYLPPFVEGNVEDDGTWDAGVLASIADYATKLGATITDGNVAIRRVVVHPDGTEPVTPSFVGFGVVPRTQRRRTPGFGS